MNRQQVPELNKSDRKSNLDRFSESMGRWTRFTGVSNSVEACAWELSVIGLWADVSSRYACLLPAVGSYRRVPACAFCSPSSKGGLEALPATLGVSGHSKSLPDIAGSV